MTRVKICGITNGEDAAAVCEAGADAIGFNFAEEAKKKSRYIEPSEARAIAGDLPPFVAAVAVTVNATIEEIEGYLEFCDWVQLHGEESPETCAAIAPHGIKVFRVGGDFNANDMTKFDARAYLLDAAVAGARGGTGKTCDWKAAQQAVALNKPIILAGGLTPENVAEAITTVRPYAVDTAGGVESAPGKKDHGRIRDFVQNAKQCLSR